MVECQFADGCNQFVPFFLGRLLFLVEAFYVVVIFVERFYKLGELALIFYIGTTGVSEGFFAHLLYLFFFFLDAFFKVVFVHQLDWNLLFLSVADGDEGGHKLAVDVPEQVVFKVFHRFQHGVGGKRVCQIEDGSKHVSE